jgi:hypothetical protein
VSLSSSEEEYFALSEAAKNIRFIVMVLEAVGITVQTSIIVKVDNVGAIFMAENVSATSRTKQNMQYPYHYHTYERRMIRSNLDWRINCFHHSHRFSY